MQSRNLTATLAAAALSVWSAGCSSTAVEPLDLGDSFAVLSLDFET